MKLRQKMSGYNKTAPSKAAGSGHSLFAPAAAQSKLKTAKAGCKTCGGRNK